MKTETNKRWQYNYKKSFQERFFPYRAKTIQEHAKLGKADIHIHSNYSDGKPGIEEILDYVQTKTDLNVIAITDHNTIEGAVLAQKMAKEKKCHFDVVVGEEISTKEGHILGLFLKEKVTRHLTVRETLKRIKAQGGISVVAHPFNYNRINGGKTIVDDGIGIVNLVKEKHFYDAVEILNATPTRTDENISGRFVNRTLLFKAEAGGSDAHILEAIGMGRTIFEGKTAEELKEAFLTKQTKATGRKWHIFALLRYLYFFIPIGLRLFSYTLLHGRKPKRAEMIDV